MAKILAAWSSSKTALIAEILSPQAREKLSLTWFKRAWTKARVCVAIEQATHSLSTVLIAITVWLTLLQTRGTSAKVSGHPVHNFTPSRLSGSWTFQFPAKSALTWQSRVRLERLAQPSCSKDIEYKVIDGQVIAFINRLEEDRLIESHMQQVCRSRP